MKRTFANLGTEASIKNTLPSVNGDNGNKQAIVPYKSRSGSIEILPQEEYPFEVGSSGEAIYYMKQERENLKTVGLYEDSENPSKKNKLIFKTDVEGQTLTRPVLLHNGESIDVDEIEGDTFTVQTSFIEGSFRHKAKFSGTYAGVKYTNADLPYGGVGAMFTIGFPGSLNPFAQWSKEAIESDASISIVTEASTEATFEVDSESIQFTLTDPDGDVVEPGQTISTYNTYRISSDSSYTLYVNGVEKGFNVTSILFTNDEVVDGRVVVKLVARESIIYSVDDESEVALQLQWNPLGSMWMPVQVGSELTIGIAYRITTFGTKANIFINNVEVASDATEFYLNLSEEYVDGGKFVVKALEV